MEVPLSCVQWPVHQSSASAEFESQRRPMEPEVPPDDRLQSLSASTAESPSSSRVPSESWVPFRSQDYQRETSSTNTIYHWRSSGSTAALSLHTPLVGQYPLQTRDRREDDGPKLQTSCESGSRRQSSSPTQMQTSHPELRLHLRSSPGSLLNRFLKSSFQRHESEAIDKVGGAADDRLQPPTASIAESPVS